MQRRKFLARLGLLVLPAPFAAMAQQASGAPRIGFLYFGSKDSAIRTGRYSAFLEGMRKLNYVVGKDFVLEERYASGDTVQLRAQAIELVGLNVKMIVATGTAAVGELQRTTRSIPIIATVTSDPVGQGLAVSLARPGGNVTGFYDSSVELVGKQLELLLAVAPGMSRVGVLSNPSNKSHVARLSRLELFAQKSRIQVHSQEGRSPGDIERAFAEMVRIGTGAVIILADPFFVQQAGQIAELALKHQLPSIALTRDYVEAGGLLSYGEDLIDNFRSAAGYVDKILKGAAPGELPFVRTPRIELAVNNKTARALSLKMPSDFLLRADRVIE
jgi:putative tryptophan/tyrosine transport system substrate-binding protein